MWMDSSYPTRKIVWARVVIVKLGDRKKGRHRAGRGRKVGGKSSESFAGLATQYSQAKSPLIDISIY